MVDQALCLLVQQGDLFPPLARRLFSFDLGLLFHGDPKVDLDARAQDPSLQALLNADLDAEEESLEDDLEAIFAYPVLSFGVSYTF